MNKIRVLIVDDSVFMRKAIESMLLKDPNIQVVGVARNGEEAIELAAKLNPDIITMDIEMPKMNGLEALAIIMKSNPIPVIMVSSLTKEGADATMKALDIGAVDFIPKDSPYGSSATYTIENDLLSKVHKFAKNKEMIKLVKLNNSPNLEKKVSDKSKRVTVLRRDRKKIVAIGTSTGGPQSLQKVIPLLPEDIGVPIVVTQHMPPNFTQSLAMRLDSLSKLKVVEAKDKEKLEPNVVYIAKGGVHLKFKKIASHIYTDLSSEPSDCFNIPSVDVMVSSIAEIMGQDCLGIIMTGMGSDGTKGLTELKARKGLVIAQDEESCIVYGMPKSVVEASLADEIVPLEDISSRIVYHCKE